ncbi:MAG: arsenite methyltransferase [Archangium sp.]|nr:arsenite methyltransferase [Archangium sp.]
MTEQIHETVREHYAAAARQVLDAPAPDARESSCGCGETVEPLDPDRIGRWGPERYEALDLAGLPDAAVLASLGCGNPTAVAELREGETVLDLGAGGGIDVLLSAKRVGASGRAIGVDMTDEMLELARRNAAEAGATNVEFVKGTIEAIPLPDATVDVVISNCVINLAADKSAVFAEIARVLRPGGRMGVSDIVADDALTLAEREALGSFAGCIAGALSFGEYADGLAMAGLTGIEIEATHAVAEGMYGAIIRARRPGLNEAPAAAPPRIVPLAVATPGTGIGTVELPVLVGDGGCCGGTGCC